MRVLFLCREVHLGGAERQLAATARGLHGRGHDVAIAVYYGGGAFEEPLRSAGVRLHDLGKRGRYDVAGFGLRLARCVSRERPDVLYSYLNPSNVLAAAMKPLHPRMKVVWGIRSAALDPNLLLRRLHTAASRFADAIVMNSDAARETVVAAGMPGNRCVVIPNGIDANEFRPDPAERTRLRQAWGVDDSEALVGTVARLNPVKNHPLFLRAARMLARALGERVRFVCVGRGGGAYARELAELAARYGVADRVTWIGARYDRSDREPWAGERAITRAVYSALDVAVFCSNEGESFPNTILEAMACATPCVSTRSGDAAKIIGDTGIVVPTGDAAALAEGILRTLRENGPLRAAGLASGADGGCAAPVRGGDKARDRAMTHYSFELLIDRTEAVLESVVAGRTIELPSPLAS